MYEFKTLRLESDLNLRLDMATRYQWQKLLLLFRTASSISLTTSTSVDELTLSTHIVESPPPPPLLQSAE